MCFYLQESVFTYDQRLSLCPFFFLATTVHWLAFFPDTDHETDVIFLIPIVLQETVDVLFIETYPASDFRETGLRVTLCGSLRGFRWDEFE